MRPIWLKFIIKLLFEIATDRLAFDHCVAIFVALVAIFISLATYIRRVNRF